MARVEFPARIPIGIAKVGNQTIDVYATEFMLRNLRTVQDSVNAVESGLTASEVSNVPAGSIAATNVQSAINELDTEKQPKDATLTSIAGVTTAADKLIYFTALDTAAAADFSSFGRSLVDDANNGAARTTLGLGTIATQNANAVAITGGTVLLASGSLGYATGNGGVVTQLTDKSTAVTLDEPSGEITMDAAALAAATIVTFVLNNSVLAVADQIVCTHHATGTFGAYSINARVTGAGAASIAVRNNTGGSLSEAIVIKFTVLKGATS